MSFLNYNKAYKRCILNLVSVGNRNLNPWNLILGDQIFFFFFDFERVNIIQVDVVEGFMIPNNLFATGRGGLTS